MSDPHPPGQVGRRRPLWSLCDDARLYELLSDAEFAGPAYEMLAISLTGYALPILNSWVATGRIYRECAGQGFPLNPTPREREHLVVHGEEAYGLVVETAGTAMAMLRRQAVTGEHKWNEQGEAALPTYYLGACKRTFPTPWRRWSREFRRRPIPTEPGSVVLERADDDGSAAVADEQELRERLRQMPSEVRRIVELKMDGYTHGQIAPLVGLRDAKAVDRTLQRWRPRLRAWLSARADEGRVAR